MKKHRKLLVLLVAALMLVTATVFITMAYLTSDDEVINTFTVGKVKIELDEAKVDVYGVPELDGEGQPVDRVKANTYKLIPGHTYVKDPRVTVLDGSEESYVRMLVTINNADILDTIFPNTDLSDIFNGFEPSIWEYEGYQKAGDTRVYEFRHNDTVSATGDQVLTPLFLSMTVPKTTSGDDLAQLNNFKIDIVAQAIQADGFADADAAWAAWE